MLDDLYGNPLHTGSQAARDAYIEAMTGYLEALPGVDAALDRAIEADPGFALAIALKARHAQVYARMDEARALMAVALEKGAGLTGRARSYLDIFDHLTQGRVRQGYAAVRAHLMDFPRDALVAQTCLGVFSLIGFSGQPGREAEHLALAEVLAPHYGEDGWFLSQLAFAQLEAGRLAPAEAAIERSLALRPQSGHGSHIRAHLYYEAGEAEAGLDYLSGWMQGYDRAGLMHCHNAWHCALWALGQGDTGRMWAIVDADLLPEVTQSPGLNVLTDLAALYWRAEMAGEPVAPERWRAVSDFASAAFPQPGLGFADIHAALAHAMAGNEAPLMRIAEAPKGPVADLVTPCAEAFRAFAAQDWAAAEAALLPVMADHARLGGSRAQRDLLELSLAQAMIRQGRPDEARRLIAMRRPRAGISSSVQGLAA